MNCASSELKQWVVYDEKNDQFLEFSHTEFKNLLLDRPIHLTDKKLLDKKTNEYIWIDGILNR